jgi:hypothetical protein
VGASLVATVATLVPWVPVAPEAADEECFVLAAAETNAPCALPVVDVSVATVETAEPWLRCDVLVGASVEACPPIEEAIVETAIPRAWPLAYVARAPVDTVEPAALDGAAASTTAPELMRHATARTTARWVPWIFTSRPETHAGTAPRRGTENEGLDLWNDDAPRR